VTDKEQIDNFNECASLMASLIEKTDSPLQVAANMMIMCLKVYKTCLSADEYESMITYIYNQRSVIEPIPQHIPANKLN
jgi:hypothetical protein